MPLDAIDPHDLLAAVQAWRPDSACVAAGGEHVRLAVRCFAAAGLSDPQIDRRVLALIGVDPEPGTDRYSAAVAVARHCATVEMPLHRIIAVLAYLAAEVPGWPDPDENAAFAQAAAEGLA